MIPSEFLATLPGFEEENPLFLSEQLITYLGNKRSLVPHIGSIIHQLQKRLKKDKLNMADLFSGTGSVARAMKRFSNSLITNDLELYNKITNLCYLENITVKKYAYLKNLHQQLVQRIEKEMTPGWLTELYAPKNEQEIAQGERVFYTRRNAIFLDTARQCIADLPIDDQKFFLAPLLAEASVHANTSGVFKGFYKNKSGVGQFGGEGRNALFRICGDITLPMPIFSEFACDVSIFQSDTNELVKRLPELDVVYLDPPYNQHPYGSNYFMLNLIAHYQRPTDISSVSGIPTNWNRSAYNQRKEAENALFDVIANSPAKFILISYNSEGFISHETFRKRLSEMGEIELFEFKYNTFRGCRNLNNRSLHVSEYLYLLEK